jgi:hypothetical protein
LQWMACLGNLSKISHYEGNDLLYRVQTPLSTKGRRSLVPGSLPVLMSPPSISGCFCIRYQCHISTWWEWRVRRAHPWPTLVPGPVPVWQPHISTGPRHHSVLMCPH